MGVPGPKGDTGIQGVQGARGPKGDKGEQGDIGLTGPIGQKGDKGDKGDKGEQGDPGESAFLFTVVAKINTVAELPSPSSLARNYAYLVDSGTINSADDKIYDLYIITGDSPNLMWTNIGPLNGVINTGNVTVNSSPNYVGTSSTILALTSDHGVAVATDTGHWYYWNGSAYVDGGVYQSSEDIELLKDNIITDISLVRYEKLSTTINANNYFERLIGTINVESGKKYYATLMADGDALDIAYYRVRIKQYNSSGTELTSDDIENNTISSFTTLDDTTTIKFYYRAVQSAETSLYDKTFNIKEFAISNTEKFYELNKGIYIDDLYNDKGFGNSDVAVYLSDGAEFTYTTDNTSTIKISDILIVKDRSSSYEFTVNDILSLATNAGLTVDTTNKTIKGSVIQFVYNQKTHTIRFDKNLSLKDNDVILFFHWYASCTIGKLVDYANIKDIDENKLSYFDEEIETSLNSIRTNMASVGMNGETFIFITDIHWESNQKHSPLLIKKILSSTNINKVICGGDLINVGTKENMIKDMLECITAYQNNSSPFYCLYGNHDNNGVNQSDPTAKLNNNEIYALMQKQMQNKVIHQESNILNFRIDDEETKTRFICLDTGNYAGALSDRMNSDNYTTFDWLAECFNTTPLNWNCIVIAHIISEVVGTPTTDATQFLKMCDAYKSKTSVTISNPNRTKSYDFTTAKGSIVAVVGGHVHYDDSWNTSGGIPVILTDCDSQNTSNTDYPYVQKTITEQAFDVITIDYVNRNIKCVRVGRGADREFTY